MLPEDSLASPDGDSRTSLSSAGAVGAIGGAVVGSVSMTAGSTSALPPEG